jgi:hypothetical protein
MTQRFRALYGAGPLQLLALLASLAIAGAAVVGWFDRPRDVINVLVWFAAAIVLHDVVLLPLYSLLDRIAFGGAGMLVAGARRPEPSRLVNPTPYLRIPAILSGLLLAVFFPVILGLGAQTELSASGIVESGYLTRWLLATGALFVVSGVAYALAVARAGGAVAAGGGAAAGGPGGAAAVGGPDGAAAAAGGAAAVPPGAPPETRDPGGAAAVPPGAPPETRDPDPDSDQVPADPDRAPADRDQSAPDPPPSAASDAPASAPD